MKSYLNKYLIIIISILLANLFVEYLTDYLLSTVDKNNYISVAIRMLVIVFVFVPMIRLVENYTSKISKKYLKQTKKISSNSFIGLIIGGAIAIAFLIIIYGHVWYDLLPW